MPFAATWTDLEIVILSEVNQTKTNICYHLHVESNFKNDINLDNQYYIAHGHHSILYDNLYEERI